MTKSTRRQFIQSTAGAAAVTLAAPYIVGQEVNGANDRIGVGFIGTGGRCGAHINYINSFKTQGIAEPVAVCDVYRPR
ncbi:MAG: gfo/Idh/MocA family oxidoreductase, partial [Planctomycetaceae bacterium]|nr:gfo/Idh/MocA family oxidoreductase [Planctomycetaceae bacterium]